MNNIKVIGFAKESPIDLAEDIEKYAKKNKLTIRQISTYCNIEKMLSERAVVIFEKAR